jgi:DNA primase
MTFPEACAAKGWGSAQVEHFALGWDGRRIVIPVRDAKGEVVASLRYLHGAKPKLIASKGERHLFPAPESLRKDVPVWVVEGEPDAISAHALGLQAVAVPGSQAWRDEWAARFAGWCKVVVCFDADEPGRSAAPGVARSLSPHAADVRLLDLAPERWDGYDMADYLLEAQAA